MPAVAARISHTAWGLDSAPTGDWRDRAACRNHRDPDLWFADHSGGTGALHNEMAKQVCRTCPVGEPCLRWALTMPEHYGVWGATTRDERDAIRRAHRGGPPPTLRARDKGMRARCPDCHQRASINPAGYFRPHHRPRSREWCPVGLHSTGEESA